MPRVSGAVITRNEAANIVECLAGLTFCDELIVVDCGSTDDTVRLAKGLGARVIHHEWTDFARQKQIALEHATGEWVFAIDADERVTPPLAAECERAIAAGTHDGYEMPRLSTFCGRTIWHSGWYPDYVLRLFRREKAHYSDHPVHTKVICEGKVGRLKTPLMHFPVDRIESAVRRMDSYSTTGAQMQVEAGKRASFSKALAHGFWAFLRTYVLRAGFLDGREGFMIAVLNAEGTYYRYIKAWLASRR